MNGDLKSVWMAIFFGKKLHVKNRHGKKFGKIYSKIDLVKENIILTAKPYPLGMNALNKIPGNWQDSSDKK